MVMASEVSHGVVVVALTLGASAVLVKVLALLWSVLWEPLKMKRIMERQGVGGPPSRFLIGYFPEAAAYGKSFPEALPLGDDFGDYSPTVTPQYALYFAKYGKRLLYWWGSETRGVVRAGDGEESARQNEAWRRLRERVLRDSNDFHHCRQRGASFAWEEVGYRKADTQSVLPPAITQGHARSYGECSGI